MEDQGIHKESEGETNWQRIYIGVLAFLIFQIVVYAIISFSFA